jgi:hypothetical protein
MLFLVISRYFSVFQCFQWNKNDLFIHASQRPSSIPLGLGTAAAPHRIHFVFHRKQPGTFRPTSCVRLRPKIAKEKWENTIAAKERREHKRKKIPSFVLS